MATKLNKTLRNTIVENAFRARFKLDIEGLTKTLQNEVEIKLLAEHPLFYKMLADKEQRQYMHVGQNLEIRHPIMNRCIRIPTGRGITTMGESDWRDLHNGKYNSSKAVHEYIHSTCSYPTQVACHVASEKNTRAWAELIDTMEEAVGVLIQTVHSAATVEDLVKAVPAMELFLPPLERKVSAALMVPEGTAERLEKLGFKK